MPSEAAASPVPDRNVPVAELTGVIERVRKMAGVPDGATGADPSEEAGAVAAATKEIQASEQHVVVAERLASRPYAARRLPDRRDSSAASDSEGTVEAGLQTAPAPAPAAAAEAPAPAAPGLEPCL